jgi:nitrite reductase (NADH) large subunit
MESLETHRHFVIIGGGVAGLTAAKAIRDLDLEAQISIYGEEAGLPYNRIKLSKALFTDLQSDKVLIKKEKWFAQNKIDLFHSTKITAIETVDHTITTQDGQTIKYDKLLLCTGALNRTLALEGASLPQVHDLRFREQAEQLKQTLGSQDRVCVIGGGIQGIETAWSLHQAGYSVTIIEQAPRLMARQLNEEAAGILTTQIESLGTKVFTGTAVTKIIGNDHVEGVALANGTVVPCEYVIYSIGIVPNITLAQQSGIHVDRGIIVNEHMQTSINDIYAAGDVAQFEGKIDGLWNTAMEQGRIAGTNIADSSAAYEALIPMTVFTAYDMPLFSIGQVDKEACIHSSCTTNLAQQGEIRYKQMFVKNGVICGAIVFDSVIAAAPYKEAIEQARPAEELELSK